MLWSGEQIQYYGWIISDPKQEKSHIVPEVRHKSFSMAMKNGMTVSVLVVHVPAVLPKSLGLLLQSLKNVLASLQHGLLHYYIHLCIRFMCAFFSSVYFPYQHCPYLQVPFQWHLTERERKTRAGRKHLYSLSALLLASDSIKCFFTLSAIQVFIRNREACIFSDLMASLPPCPPRNGLFTCVSQNVVNLVRSHWLQA